MKVELHSHTSRYSGCSVIHPRELVAMAERTGYDVVFVTDHGRVWNRKQLAEFREWSDNVRVLPGIEISFPDRVDMLILGADSPVYERLATPSEILAQACHDGYLTIICHPFRWLKQLPDYCTMADAIEIRTCNHPDDIQKEAALEYAERYHLAPLYASDAHGLNFMNRFWIETEVPFETPGELRRLILSGQYQNR